MFGLQIHLDRGDGIKFVTVFSTLIGDRTFCALSDVLLTADRAGNHATFPNLIYGGQESTDSFIQAGTRQKTILPTKRSLFQWAGSEIVARSIYSHARNHRDALLRGELDFLSQYSESERENISFLIAGFISKELKVLSYNCEHCRTEGMDEYKEGTASYLLDNAPIEFETARATASDTSPLFIQSKRLLNFILGEIGLYEYLSFRAGLWYELTAFDGFLFRKIPYAVVLWREREDGFTLERIAHCYYVHDALYVRNFEVKEQSPKDVAFVITGFKGKHPSGLDSFLFSEAQHSYQLILHFVAPQADPGHVGGYVSWSEMPQLKLNWRRSSLHFDIKDTEINRLHDFFQRKPPLR